MWTNKHGIYILSKGDNIMANNVIGVETKNQYYMTRLDNTEKHEITYRTWSTNRLVRMANLIREMNGRDITSMADMFTIIDGVKGNLCDYCEDKFSGYTNNCSFVPGNSDKFCKPKLVIDIKPPTLKSDGLFLPAKYFDSYYKPYRRDASLEQFNLSLGTIERSLFYSYGQEHIPDLSDELKSKYVTNQTNKALSNAGQYCIYKNKRYILGFPLEADKVVIWDNDKPIITTFDKIEKADGLWGNFGGYQINKAITLLDLVLSYLDKSSMMLNSIGKCQTIKYSSGSWRTPMKLTVGVKIGNTDNIIELVFCHTRQVDDVLSSLKWVLTVDSKPDIL